jgi:uncharacterized protein DUF2849
MQLVTGNRLRDGAVVYFAGAGQWSPEIDAALLVEDDRAETLLAEAQQGAAPLPAVGIELIEATREAGHIRPVSLRERIRAFGPTTGPMANRRAIDAALARS